MNRLKIANTDHPILDVLANRYSPRAFTDQPISEETLLSLLEAMRWAPSSMNEQPWRTIFAHTGDESFGLISQTLKDSNRTWAENAAVLMLTIVKDHHANGAPNAYAWHDMGLAVANLATQATHEGIGVHQMGGFSVDKAHQLFNLPAGFTAVSVLALGYFGEPEQLPEQLRAREEAPRQRKKIEEFAFRGIFKT